MDQVKDFEQSLTPTNKLRLSDRPRHSRNQSNMTFTNKEPLRHSTANLKREDKKRFVFSSDKNMPLDYEKPRKSTSPHLPARNQAKKQFSEPKINVSLTE